MDFRILLAFILLSTAGCLGESISVSCTPQTICALQESEVKLNCSYANINIKTVFWFSFKQKAKWRDETHPEDLALDSDYTGRVTTENINSSSILIIKDLRERDSGEYHLMIITEQGQKHLSSVNLRVTDLQVKKMGENLTCSTSCTLTFARQRYFWYNNGQYTERDTYNSDPFILSRTDEGSYSCSVFGYNGIFSPPLCVSSKNCWNVTYTERRVCVLEGSSVDFPCTFSYPSGLTVSEVFWHYLWIANPKDLTQENQFTPRVRYLRDKKGNCSLRMTDVQKNDSGVYYFRIVLKKNKLSGKPGVILNITDLQVRVIPSAESDGHTVTLMCSSTCTLPNNPTYIWYKNGKLTNKPTRDNKLYLKCGEEAGNYSCAVKGYNQSHSFYLNISTACPEILQTPPPQTLGAIVGVSVFLVLILIIAAVWMWRRKSRPAKNHGSTGQSTQAQDDVHYSSIHFPQSHTKESHGRPRNTTEGEQVQYATVKFTQ